MHFLHMPHQRILAAERREATSGMLAPNLAALQVRDADVFRDHALEQLSTAALPLTSDPVSG